MNLFKVDFKIALAVLLFAVVISSSVYPSLVINPSSPLQISNATGFSGYPSIVWNSNSGRFAIVWSDGRDSLWQIYYARVTSGGVIDKSERVMNQNGASRAKPNLTYENGSSDNFAVWGGYSFVWGDALLFQNFDSNGSSNDTGTLRYPYTKEDKFGLTTRGSRFGVAAADTYFFESDIFYYETDTGGSIKNQLNVTSSLSGECIQPSISTDGSKYAIAFCNNSRGIYEIYLAILSSSGDISSLKRIGTHDNDAYYPEIVYNTASGEYGIVYYETYGGSNSIFFQRASKSGDAVGSRVLITTSGGVSKYPQITTDGTNYAIVYQNNMWSNFDIFFALLSKDGAFLETGQVIASSEYDLERADIAYNGSLYGVAWQRTRDTNTEVFFTTVTVVSPTPTPSPTPSPSPTPTPPAVVKVLQENWDSQGDWVCWGAFPEQAPSSIASHSNGKLVCTWEYPLPAPQFFQWLKWDTSHTAIDMSIPYQSGSIYLLGATMSSAVNESVPQIRLRAQSGDNRWTAYGMYAQNRLEEGGGVETTPQNFYCLWQPQGSTSDAFAAVDIFNGTASTGTIFVDQLFVYRIPIPDLYSVEYSTTDFSYGWSTLSGMTNVSIGSQIIIGDTSTWSTAGSYIKLNNAISPGRTYLLKYSLSKFGENPVDNIRLRVADCGNGFYSSNFVLSYQDIGVASSEYYLFHMVANWRDVLGDVTAFIDTLENGPASASIVLSKLIIQEFTLPSLQ